MTLTQLQACNPALTLHTAADPAFARYGRALTGYDFSECFRLLADVPVPAQGNVYVASMPQMTQSALGAQLRDGFYGGEALQIGYCNGRSDRLNALEYHKGEEIDAAGTDLVLLLGDVRDICGNRYPSERAEAFFLPAGTVVALYATTLHFAPCRVSDDGFKSIIVLPAGTNAPLEARPAPRWPEDELLWMRNKWLIAHPESIPASRGACAGITGENIRVRY